MEKIDIKVIIIIDIILLFLLLIAGCDLLIESNKNNKKDLTEFYQCMKTNNNEINTCKKYLK